jgi:hypothetical protein
LLLGVVFDVAVVSLLIMPYYTPVMSHLVAAVFSFVGA